MSNFKNKKKGTVSLNPSFDQRMTSIGVPTGRTLRRGWIATDNTTTPAPPVPGRVNFLFNPPQVTVSHPLNPMYQSQGYTDQLQQYNAEWVGDTLGQAGEVGMSLLFDRTYELWDNKYKGTLQGEYGAYVDVLAFYKLLGIVDSTTGPMVGPVAPGASRPNITNFGLYPQNPLRGTPICFLYLGPNSLKFRGFVDNFNVTYTHFSKGMIPMRVQVDLSMQMYFNPSDMAQGVDLGGSVVTPGAPTSTAPGDGGYPGSQLKPPLKAAPQGTTGNYQGHVTWTDPETGITWWFDNNGVGHKVP